MTEIDRISCFSIKIFILTSERQAEHLFAVRNTQQLTHFYLFSVRRRQRQEQYRKCSKSFAILPQEGLHIGRDK